MILRRFTASLFLTLIIIFLLPLSVLAAMNLLTNSGFNDPFNDIPGRIWNSQPEKIADGWQPFYIAANTYKGDSNAPKLHWLSSQQFAAAFGGYDYHIEGNRAQNLWSSYKFDAGVYQQISVAASKAYGFDIAMTTYWRGPGYADSNGIMVKQVGIDPTGGTDPTSPNIIWSDPDSNDKAWVYMDIGATALNTTITVFAKVQAPDNNSVNHTDLDMVYFEAAHVAETSAINLNVSASGTTVNLNWTPANSPGSGWSLKGYEAQYKDLANGNWVTLQSKTGVSQINSFAGQAGHSYAVRVRAWQKTTESYNSDIDMPGPWQEKNITVGALVTGKVMTNQRFWGSRSHAWPKLASDPSATTDDAGNFTLGLATAGTYTFTVTTNSGWTAPPSPPTSVLLNTTSLSFTLNPPDQTLQNNDFENGFTDWQVSGTAPGSNTSERHSGNYSLVLTGSTTLSQTGTIANSYQPILSFWYKMNNNNGGDTFTAKILGDSGLISTNTFATSSNSEWQHVWLPLNWLGFIAVRLGRALASAKAALPFTWMMSAWALPGAGRIKAICRSF
ncbi:MAG: fibronectin type III domain-containing protein [Anaerolineae bacterium]